MIVLTVPDVRAVVEPKGNLITLRHLVQEIVDRLGLTQESAGDRSRKIRYVSAWFDDELTSCQHVVRDRLSVFFDARSSERECGDADTASSRR
jgi:hypothetical protein